MLFFLSFIFFLYWSINFNRKTILFFVCYFAERCIHSSKCVAVVGFMDMLNLTRFLILSLRWIKKEQKTNRNDMLESWFVLPVHLFLPFSVMHRDVLYNMTFSIWHMFCLDLSRVTSSCGFWLTKSASDSSSASSDRLWRSITDNSFYLRWVRAAGGRRPSN